MYDLLSGLSIIEASSFVASPTAGLYCAQMGAEVIRVDHKAGGLDYDRYMLTKEGRSLSWENLNRAKKSVALDLRSGEGRELLVELSAKTGNLITNLPEKSFLSHGAIAARRPDLVSVRIMGWHDGRQAMDFTVNAASGYPLMCGPEDWDPATAPPVNQVLPAWDFVTGAYCAFALLAGLRHRDASGEGSEIRVPLGDVAIGTMANSGAMAEMLYRGGDRERLGNAIWGAFGRDFRSRDGVRFMVAALTAKQWDGLVAAFDLADEIAELENELNVRFADGDRPRFEHRHRLFELFGTRSQTYDWHALSDRLTQHGTTFERYRTMHEAANDAELVTENPLFGPSPANPSGFEYPATRSFANIPTLDAGLPRAAPYLGQHTEEVLADRLGLASGAIGDLVDRGIARLSDKD
ncbi:carnitine dehydratase [Erythrobacter sp. SAORIC-644]|jgi:2-methylfumaryl-CoA isomerase|uniref:CoA transferase n=1 Tax=Erythrobacter sp. SAORIC-644 TaxID=1869314 RepID=UPI000C0E5347|nr:CoA transferase [Erythrobacter sp. SAORIC-644]MBL4897452.1 CoA transferase [Erythrobacter sp.]PHR02917.1 MAG: carnitine dehydratase [Erythrobacter sp.]PNQ76133.1 carnitine dehydratase [Erythrobacter sp. SAORIC-644]QPL40027.1 CoA transferase [Erythrobacter sp. A30-3]